MSNYTTWGPADWALMGWLAVSILRDIAAVSFAALKWVIGVIGLLGVRAYQLGRNDGEGPEV